MWKNKPRDGLFIDHHRYLRVLDYVAGKCLNMIRLGEPTRREQQWVIYRRNFHFIDEKVPIERSEKVLHTIPDQL